MKPLLLLCLSFVLSFSLLQASIVENTCKHVTKNKKHYDFCVASFQASPESRNADTYRLSIIGLQLALENHSDSLIKSKNLMDKSGLPPKIKSCITECFHAYMSSTVALNDAIDNATDELPFTSEITAASQAPEACLKAFKAAGQKDLLARENYNALILDAIMTAFDVFLNPRN